MTLCMELGVALPVSPDMTPRQVRTTRTLFLNLVGVWKCRLQSDFIRSFQGHAMSYNTHTSQGLLDCFKRTYLVVHHD